MANPEYGYGAFSKTNQVPQVIARHQRKLSEKKALDAAYRATERRDGNVCRVTGEPVSPQAKEYKHLREHHHLRGRNVKPEWKFDASRIIVVSKLAHDLITAGWIDVEGDDATKRIVFTWAEHVKPALRPFQLRSRRRCQQ